MDSYYVIWNDLQTVNRVAITIDANNEKSGPVLIDYQDYDGDGTVRLHSALAGGSISGHFLYKYPAEGVSAEHTGIIKDEGSSGTFKYIQDVINNDCDNLYNTNQEGFYALYLGYRNPQ